MKKKAIVGVTALVVLSLNSAVFYVAQGAGTSTTVSTIAAVKSAKWNPTVKLTYSSNSIIMQPDGIPNHPRDTYYAVPKSQDVVVPDATTAIVIKDPTKAQAYKFTIPSTPKYSATVAMANNFTITDANGITASFVDKCAGHPVPMQGAYHYHGLSTCITSKVDKAAKPSHMIGLALDGFPIYGDRDIKGKQLTAKNLDMCNGIYSPTPEFPKGIYHYVLLGTADVRSSIACFHGVVDASQIQAMPNMGGGMPMPDLAEAAAKLGITQEKLVAAFEGKQPPDLARAATNLGITESELRKALGI